MKMNEGTDIIEAGDAVLQYVRDELGSPSNQATAKLLLIVASALCRKQGTWEEACAMAWKMTHPESVN